LHSKRLKAVPVRLAFDWAVPVLLRVGKVFRRALRSQGKDKKIDDMLFLGSDSMSPLRYWRLLRALRR